jgi:hypothetical protein
MQTLNKIGERVMMNKLIAGCAAAVAALVITASASAAMLSGQAYSSVSSPADLTDFSEGGDWALWNSSASPSSGVPNNRKAGVTPLIGDVSPLVGANARGVTAASLLKFSYDDGVSPTSASNVDAFGITDASLNTSGAGVELDITGDPSKLLFVRLFVAGFRATGNLTATLAGATTYTDSSLSWTESKVGRMYLLRFQPDNVSDKLHIEYSASSTGSNGHLLLSAVAVAVPTPAALPAGLGLLSLITLRRSRR